MSPATKTAQMELFALAPEAATSKTEVATKYVVQCIKYHETYISDHQVASRYGVSRATIWRWVESNPEFPKPVKLSPGTTRWKLSDLVRFEAQRDRDGGARLKSKMASEFP